MKNIILMTILSILPLQGFCDLFWVCDQTVIQDQINTIEQGGGVVLDIQSTRLNDSCISYIIRFNW